MTRTAQLLTLLNMPQTAEQTAATLELIKQTARIEALILTLAKNTQDQERNAA